MCEKKTKMDVLMEIWKLITPLKYEGQSFRQIGQIDNIFRSTLQSNESLIKFQG